MKTVLEKIRARRSLLHWVIFSVIMLGSLALYFTARSGGGWMTAVLLALLVLANLLAVLL